MDPTVYVATPLLSERYAVYLAIPEEVRKLYVGAADTQVCLFTQDSQVYLAKAVGSPTAEELELAKQHLISSLKQLFNDQSFSSGIELLIRVPNDR